ncbi:cytochrome P450 [Galbibacter pacificus]|uniref:Cytochrome P450 n=1 Tax=Galbibacter pacificus TaxID=2996052 RepID=A0ABT6FNB7_9FLAO|nr:cytochrome P450 [Galbibacter pacificus]MDG3581281.1 cytochrome P450 [Galbibacter pacificus]MDG3584759.1 cytochrome P450 [Galbibacter pacificus]
MNNNAIVYKEIEDIQLAKEVLRHPSFGVIRMDQYLEKLQELTKEDLGLLIRFSKKSLIFQSGESHIESRRLIAHFFSHREVQRWRDSIGNIVEDIMADHTSNDIEVLSDFSDPLFVSSMIMVMGIQVKEEDLFLEHIKIAKAITEPLLSKKRLRRIQISLEYLINLVKESFKEKDYEEQSFLSHIKNKIEKPWDKYEELHILVVSLIIAAHTFSETFVIIMSKLASPMNDLWSKTKDFEWLNKRIDAFIRLYPTTQSIGRRVIKDCNILNTQFQKNEIVYIKVPIVNRNPIFTDEEDILSGTEEIKCPFSHVSFGGGIHKCPGASLSRMIFMEAFSILASKFPEFVLTKPLNTKNVSFMVSIPSDLQARLKLMSDI